MSEWSVRGREVEGGTAGCVTNSKMRITRFSLSTLPPQHRDNKLRLGISDRSGSIRTLRLGTRTDWLKR